MLHFVNSGVIIWHLDCLCEMIPGKIYVAQLFTRCQFSCDFCNVCHAEIVVRNVKFLQKSCLLKQIHQILNSRVCQTQLDQRKFSKVTRCGQMRDQIRNAHRI